MASGLDLTVAVEQAIHSGFKEALQEISSKYGIQVARLEVEWSCVSDVGSPSFQIRELRAETFSR